MASGNNISPESRKEIASIRIAVNAAHMHCPIKRLEDKQATAARSGQKVPLSNYTIVRLKSWIDAQKVNKIIAGYRVNCPGSRPQFNLGPLHIRETCPVRKYCFLYTNGKIVGQNDVKASLNKIDSAIPTPVV